MKRATVTGADGFVGQWLLRLLLDEGFDVTGLIRGARPALTTLAPDSTAHIRWRTFDLSNLEQAKSIFKAANPDLIFHLAAQSSVPESIAHPLDTIEANVSGTLNVLEAARRCAPHAGVLTVGSSDAYGIKSPESMPLREDAPLDPRNPYAASKAAAEIIALQYAQSGWCRVIATRSFNHSGPGQSTRFALAAFAKQIAEVKARRRPPHVRVGALEPRRDISDVRDVVRAYLALAERGQSGAVYNVCSGHARSMRQLLDELIELAGIEVETIEDHALLRAVETPLLVGDPGRIKREVGWQPEIELRRTLRDLLEYYAG